MIARADRDPDVLFLIGASAGESKRYRVYNLLEAIEQRGFRCRVLDFYAMAPILAEPILPRVAIFFRAPFDPGTGVIEVLHHFRINAVPTIFDIDDYVFEPAIVDRIAGASGFDPARRFAYAWGVRAYRSMLFSCDRVTVSTPYLADRLRELGRDVAVVPNSVNAEQRQLAARLGPGTGSDDGAVRLCYLSGSRTHQRDFAAAAPAIKALLAARAGLVLRLVGHLELDESWHPFAERIERFGFMSPMDMLRRLHACDINLAPLEEGNPFCEGKSELKFFEAALVGVPTVASRTAAYAAAIDDGETGFLASGASEWEMKLAGLIDDVDLRRAIGARARAVALARFNNGVAARQALVEYGLIDRRPPGCARRDALKIGWLLPDPRLIDEPGDDRLALRAAIALEQAGHDVRLHMLGDVADVRALRMHARAGTAVFEGPVALFDGGLSDEDVVVATHWSTVAPARAVDEPGRRALRFIGEFEPAAEPLGTRHLLAEASYRLGLPTMLAAPSWRPLLERRYGSAIDVAGPLVDLAGCGLDPDMPRRDRVLLHLAPARADRCAELGMAAMRHLHRLRPEVEIALFGDGPLGGEDPFFDAGSRPALADRAALYAAARVGVALSAGAAYPVAYEMMACGLPVVDLDRPHRALDYGGSADAVLLVPADPAEIARSIACLLDDRDRQARQARHGLAIAASLPTMDAYAATLEAWLRRRLAERRAG